MKLDQKTIKDRLKTKLGLDADTSKIIVVGLGVTGISIARFLVKLGFEFTIADSREQSPELGKLYDELANIKCFTGKFDAMQFRSATHLIVSPGISLGEKAIANAVANGTLACGDIDLFACSVDAPIIAITGSNGKSTVTTLVGEMAKAAGKRTGVGGNLGTPALDLLEQVAELFVLELSSFQLERTSQLNASVATVLNISADHLDRHESLADYAAQKQRIFMGDGVMVINIDDPRVAAMRKEGRKLLTFSIQQKADFWIGEDQGINYLMQDDKPILPLS